MLVLIGVEGEDHPKLVIPSLGCLAIPGDSSAHIPPIPFTLSLLIQLQKAMAFLLLLLFLLNLVQYIETDALAKGKPSYYWRDRWLECVNHGISISRCALFEEGRVSELNPGCFDELDQQTNLTRVYCRLNCEESDEATVLRKEPPNNHICSAYHTYNLERRRRDWYLWRTGECISTTIKFVLRCGFPSDPRVFYAQNKHLFDYEDSTSNNNNNRNGNSG